MVFSHHLPHVDEHVRLKTDIPDLGLHCGEWGSVCSTWFSPATVFEVEFKPPGVSCPVRAIVLENQIEADEQPQSGSDV
jgi:hypothetical protein